jgi:hypothetical protein
VAGILTGGHTRDRLHRAGATHLLGSIAELPAVLDSASGAAEPVIDPATLPPGMVSPPTAAPLIPPT